MSMESMSHCGCSSVEIQFSTFFTEEKKPPAEPSHHTHVLLGSGPGGTQTDGNAVLLQTCNPPLSGSDRWQSG